MPARQDHEARFRPARHDAGQKTFLGVDGTLDDTDVVEILAELPETANHISRKLWRFFAVDPTPEALDRTTEVYFESGGSIGEVVRAILLSDEMYSPAAYRSRIKSPVEFVIGMQRALELTELTGRERWVTQALSQVVFDPPGPAGWPDGLSWINSNSILRRANYVNELLRTRRTGSLVDVAALVRRHQADESAAEVADFFIDFFLAGDTDAATRGLLVEHLGGTWHFDFDQAAEDRRLAGGAYLAMTMPLYQLA